MNPAEHSDPRSGNLPSHTRITMGAGVQRLAGREGTTALLGGSPLRLLRLRPAAMAELDRWLGGEPVGERPAVLRLARRLLDAGVADPGWPSASTGRIPGRYSPADVTLVIPARDRAAMVAHLLESVASMDNHNRPAHVIVVDDASGDDTAAVARHHGATVITNSTARGPGAARNSGLDGATTSLVAFVDSDCVLRPGWLPPLLAHLEDPSVALVAPRIVAAHPNSNVVDRYEAGRSPLDMGPLGGYVVPLTRIAYLPAAALLARVAPLRALGGFAAELAVGEDVDLVWRLHEAGWRVRYEPVATVAHSHRTQLGQMLKRRAQYGTSAAVLTHRHPGQVTPLAVSGWSAMAWALAALGGPAGAVAGVGVGVVTSALLPRKLTMLAQPGPVAWRLAGRGHLGAGRLIGSAVWRAWLPVAVIAALGSRRARVAVVAAGVLPALAEWRTTRPGVDPVRYGALRMADDAAYCMGVWQGCWRQRSAAALVPDLRNWPGRRRPDEDGDQ